MGLAAIIAAAVGVQYVNDLSKGSVTPKPLIGGGIVIIILSAVSEGVSKKLAVIMAWIILLSVLLNGSGPLLRFLDNAGGSDANFQIPTGNPVRQD